MEELKKWFYYALIKQRIREKNMGFFEDSQEYMLSKRFIVFAKTQIAKEYLK